jgi:hypothetical protein
MLTRNTKRRNAPGFWAKAGVPLLTVSLFLVPSIWGIVILVCLRASEWAAANGGLSGTFKDASGAVVPGATITLVNTALRSES